MTQLKKRGDRSESSFFRRVLRRVGVCGGCPRTMALGQIDHRARNEAGSAGEARCSGPVRGSMLGRSVCFPRGLQGHRPRIGRYELYAAMLYRAVLQSLFQAIDAGRLRSAGQDSLCAGGPQAIPAAHLSCAATTSAVHCYVQQDRHQSAGPWPMRPPTPPPNPCGRRARRSRVGAHICAGTRPHLRRNRPTSALSAASPSALQQSKPQTQ
jgi:hypothetical protein